MKVLWAPWRLAYVETGGKTEGCILCDYPRLDSPDKRREALVLRSNDRASVIMNLYPYASAHLMVSPREHTADFAGLGAEAAAGLQSELQIAVAALEKAFAPGGMNIGMNLGRAAGAGIDDHLHWHVVPRWQGDTNFMPLLAETRVMPQHLEETYDRLLAVFEEFK